MPLNILEGPFQIPGYRNERYIAQCPLCQAIRVYVTYSYINKHTSCGCKKSRHTQYKGYEREYHYWKTKIRYNENIKDPSWRHFQSFLDAVGPISNQFITFHLTPEHIWAQGKAPRKPRVEKTHPSYGLWTVQKENPDGTCQVQCACGKVETVKTSVLRFGQRSSCGCQPQRPNKNQKRRLRRKSQ